MAVRRDHMRLRRWLSGNGNKALVVAESKGWAERWMVVRAAALWAHAHLVLEEGVVEVPLEAAREGRPGRLPCHAVLEGERGVGRHQHRAVRGEVDLDDLWGQRPWRRGRGHRFSARTQLSGVRSHGEW